MAFEDFRKSVLKVNEKRHHKIKDSLGVRDAFLWCKRNKIFNTGDKVTEKDFYKIIRTVNKLISRELIEGRDVKFPLRMGQLEIRKYDNYVKFIDGKLRTNRGIDWNATLKLWYEDEEAREEKFLVRKENLQTFTIFYNKAFANFENKSLFLFKPHREVLEAVRAAGNNGLIDAFKIGL